MADLNLMERVERLEKTVGIFEKTFMTNSGYFPPVVAEEVKEAAEVVEEKKEE